MPWFEDGDGTPPWLAQEQSPVPIPMPKPVGVVAQTQAATPGLLGSANQASAQPVAQQAALPQSAPAAQVGDPYQMLLGAKFASDYKTPDWYKASGLALDQTPEKMRQFFNANPQYAEDWARITSGQKSAYSTDGSSLIRTDFASMSPEARAHYAKNPNDLLAAEGFGQDPTLTYMNYNYGPGSIGVKDPRRTNVTDYLRNNTWTPDGLVSGRNPGLNAKLGSGTQSYLDAAGRSSPPGTGGDMPGYNKPGTGGDMPVYNGPTAPTPPSVTSGGAVTNASVDYGTSTVEGRIKSLLATDAAGGYTNPVVQQAANSVMQQFAGRGLLNSSMASEAAYQAAIAKAIEIAGPDAQTYFAQGRANQDASNVFERDARGYTQENYKLSLDMEKFNKELQYRYDALKIDKETQDDARALAQKYALEMENVRSVNSAYDLYLRRVSDIDSNVNYDATTKAKLKNEAGKDFDLYAKAKGIAWEMSLGNRFAADAAATASQPQAQRPSVANFAGA